MKVHPAPANRNIRYDFGLQPTATSTAVDGREKKLRRLSHIFAKVFELPFYSDSDVSFEDTPNTFTFVVDTDDDIGTDVAAHTIEIVPSVTKIVVRSVCFFSSFPISIDELELKVLRFRLPASTHPELATAAFSDGELVVTVPKGVDLDQNQNEV